MNDSSTPIQRIAQLAVLVRDPDRALRFYRDTLGLRLLFQASPDLSFFDCGGVRLMLTPPLGAESGRATSVVYYGVTDIRAAHEALADRGVRFEEEPHIVAALPDRDVWLAGFRDSEENMLALLSEVPRER